MVKKGIVFMILIIQGLLSGTLYAQKINAIKNTSGTVCYAHTHDNQQHIPPPEAYLKYASGARKKTSTIEVIYNPGFTEEAKVAFNYAIGIWESLISSPVTITIDAYWSSLNPGTLGGALYTSAYANFSGVQKLNTYYPVALAEKISGRNLNGNDPEIFIQFNNSVNWQYDPTAVPTSGQFDLATVVMHEIGHGLGFSASFNASSFGLAPVGYPLPYDVPLENAAGSNLIRSVLAANLPSEIVSDNLYFTSPSVSRARIYAPAEFRGGSSISHLNEVTYNATSDALMTPTIAPLERIYNPGLAWSILKDIGWEHVSINHQRLKDRENVVNPFVVTATVIADNGYNTGSVKLNYSTDGNTFTTVTMTPTGTPNEFTGTIPSTGVAQQYGYYISLDDNAGRPFVYPGKTVRRQNSELQTTYRFETGPDIKPPIVSHSPKSFLLNSESSLLLEARVTDNLGVAQVLVEYSINDIAQTPQPLSLKVPEEDSIYSILLNFATLADGDEIKYRIVATDNSSNNNQGASPKSGVHTINVVFLAATRDSYSNDFNTPSSDFIGNGFSVSQPSGFTNAAIHSDHPYAEGNGFPNNQLNLIYQLIVPVRVNARDALLRFDEIVLVEPGENNVPFGEDDFYDYVVVEGSKDGGVSWTPVADGYDSRAESTWLTRYNSSITSNNSTATGDPTLFKTRAIDLLNTFAPGDEVIIRFRLYSDPFATGWGWAIDNLKIQIDDTAPRILHDHFDYLTDDADELALVTKVTDVSGIEELKIEYRINNGDSEEILFVVNPPAPSYTLKLQNLTTLSDDDLIEYRIIARDSAGNIGQFPAEAEFIKVPILTIGTPVSTYANNFNSSSTDFVGNFFTISQPTGFTDGAIHSPHFYSNGFGLDETSSINYVLKKPITISSSNPLMRFDEVVIVEGHFSNAVFGTPEFWDYVIVEGSKDGGTTWNRLLNGYDIVGGEGSWIIAFNTRAAGNATMFRKRTIDLTNNDFFNAGDQILIRFRLFANATNTGWGWAIDNLFIQDPITSVESPLQESLSIYPNPVSGHILNVEGKTISPSPLKIELLTVFGNEVHTALVSPSNQRFSYSMDISELSQGVYLVVITGDTGERVVRKVILTD